MKANIKITHTTAEMISLCYTGILASIEYARGITRDPEVHHSIKEDFLHVISDLKSPIERIDRRIPKESWNQFKSEIKECDSLRLENIKSIYSRMTPAQQEMLEMGAEGILKQEIEIG